MSEQKMILIVEDDVTLASLWQTYLRTRNYIVNCCSTVSDAEVLLHCDYYHLVVVDIFLENSGDIGSEGGVTLINRIRLNSTGTNTGDVKIPILAVTGSNINSRYGPGVLHTVENLVNATLQKPIPLEVLGEYINSNCR